jgi:hypothetical protein
MLRASSNTHNFLIIKLPRACNSLAGRTGHTPNTVTNEYRVDACRMNGASGVQQEERERERERERGEGTADEA